MSLLKQELNYRLTQVESYLSGLLGAINTWTGKQTFSGGAAIKGATSAVAAGDVGQVVALTARTVSGSNGAWAVGSSVFEATEGVWLIIMRAEGSAAASGSQFVHVISTNNTADYTNVGSFSSAVNSNVGNSGYIITQSVGAATYYPKLYCYGAGTTGTYTGWAIRIA